MTISTLFCSVAFFIIDKLFRLRVAIHDHLRLIGRMQYGMVPQ